MSCKKSLMVMLALLSMSSTLFAGQNTAVIVYGDSLSDNGNLYNATGQAYPPDPPYYEGRRSNGPVAVEQLATSLNVPLRDYAWIGATTGSGNYGDGGTVTTMGQYNWPGMATMYDATKGAITPYLSQGLFIVWGGPNDILAPSPLDTTPGEIIFRALADELAIILDLKGRGARTILAPGMPDLGLTPYFQSLGPVIAAQGTAFTDAFNAGLQAELPPGVLYYDTAGLLRSVVHNPTAYGFTNATDYYLRIPRTDDPNDYVFYDDFHPTTAVHTLLAREFQEVTAVPEPSAIVILGSGFALLLLRRRRL